MKEAAYREENIEERRDNNINSKNRDRNKKKKLNERERNKRGRDSVCVCFQLSSCTESIASFWMMASQEVSLGL